MIIIHSLIFIFILIGIVISSILLREFYLKKQYDLENDFPLITSSLLLINETKPRPIESKFDNKRWTLVFSVKGARFTVEKIEDKTFYHYQREEVEESTKGFNPYLFKEALRIKEEYNGVFNYINGLFMFEKHKSENLYKEAVKKEVEFLKSN